jgi:hypothetical protein
MAQGLGVDVRRQTRARGVDRGAVAGATSQVESTDGQVARITTTRVAAHAYAGVAADFAAHAGFGGGARRANTRIVARVDGSGIRSTVGRAGAVMAQRLGKVPGGKAGAGDADLAAVAGTTRLEEQA